MLLHTLPKIVDSKSKRKGRGVGSGSGAKSGRGTTRHQKSRENIPLHFEGGQNKITKKYPLLRGKGRNKAIFAKPYIVNVASLEVFKKGARIDINALIEMKIVPSGAVSRGVKLLGRGTVTQSFDIAIPVSKKAEEKILKAGGKLITL